MAIRLAIIRRLVYRHQLHDRNIYLQNGGSTKLRVSQKSDQHGLVLFTAVISD